MRQKLFTLIMLLATAIGMNAQDNKNRKEMNATTNHTKVLVAFFSRADENYAVGNIKKGNTHIVAEMIAAETGADLFHIETIKPYPAEYKRCIEVAQKEKQTNARPAIKGDIDVENYDIIFLGYPNWWGEMPMAIYTFIEKHGWKGKNIIPFCTHEGSGLAGTEQKIRKACAGANVLEGLALRGYTAQRESITAFKAIQAWLIRIKENL